MGKQIVLIDSDQHFLKLVASVLEGRGHKALPCSNLKEADEKIKTADMVIVGSPLSEGGELPWLLEKRRAGMTAKLVLVGSSANYMEGLKNKLTADHSVSLSVHKPLIPYIFGAQVDRTLDDDKSEAAAQKMKDFETMFLALVTKYARVLPNRIMELAEAIQKAKNDPSNAELTQEVRGLAHKIKGTGGSLGFRKVSELMAYIEDAAAEVSSKPKDGTTDHLVGS